MFCDCMCLIYIYILHKSSPSWSFLGISWSSFADTIQDLIWMVINFLLFCSFCFKSLLKESLFSFLCFILSARLNLQKSLEIVSYVAFFSTWRSPSPGRKHGVSYPNRRPSCSTCMVLHRYVQGKWKRLYWLLSLIFEEETSNSLGMEENSKCFHQPV